jgi:hypothetical protein
MLFLDYSATGLVLSAADFFRVKARDPRRSPSNRELILDDQGCYISLPLLTEPNKTFFKYFPLSFQSSVPLLIESKWEING